MIKKTAQIAFLFLFSGTLFAQKALTLQDTMSMFFNEAKLATGKAKKLWDKDIYGPLLLVNPITRQAYANCPDSAGVLKKEGDIYACILPPSVVLGNASLQWSGVTWAMILVLPPTYLSTNKQDRVGLLAHELFHVAQPSLHFPGKMILITTISIKKPAGSTCAWSWKH